MSMRRQNQLNNRRVTAILFTNLSVYFRLNYKCAVKYIVKRLSDMLTAVILKDGCFKMRSLKLFLASEFLGYVFNYTIVSLELVSN